MEGVTKAPKLRHVVKEPYRVFGHSYHTVFIQRTKLAERIAADEVTLAPRPAAVPLILPKSASKWIFEANI